MEPTKPAADPAVKDPKNATPGAEPGKSPAGAEPVKPGDPPVTPPVKPGEEDPTKMVPLTALHEERDRVKSLREEVDILKTLLPKQAGFTPPPGTPYQPPQVQQPPQGQSYGAELDAKMQNLWEQDPRRAMQAEIMLNQDYQNRATASIALQEDQLLEKHPDYNTFRPQVQRYLAALAPAQKMQPGIVEAGYYFVKGQQVDKLTATATEEMITKLKAGESVQGVTGTVTGPIVPSEAGKPTAEEINAASAMNMSVEDYMKNKR